jgi:3-hydroxyacyl-[acyl-carrier-protein] dehydratase
MNETAHPNSVATLAGEAGSGGAKSGPLDINQIQAILPHRYPLLLIDRVLEIERKKKIVAIKNVTINEPFFAGHFPGFPIMPGVLIVEAMAQAGGALLLTEVEDRAGKLIVFTGIEKARFRRPVVPGDQLRLEVEMLSWKAISSRIAVKIGGKGFVNGKLVCEATLSCQLVERPSSQAAPAAEPGTTE